MKIIAKIKNDFHTKFGIPRQSGLVNQVKSKIVFEPEYRVAEAFRGLEEYSHIWIIWEFSESKRGDWSPTVRPPRLGGNKRVGVFATRSPFRPSPIGLSCVKLEKIDFESKSGPVLLVSGADLMNDTPIYDIKPYLPRIDSLPDAIGGFADRVKDYKLSVCIDKKFQSEIPADKLKAIKEILSEDPRPSYHNDPSRIYGFNFAEYEITFKVDENILTVLNIKRN